MRESTLWLGVLEQAMVVLTGFVEVSWTGTARDSPNHCVPSGPVCEVKST